MYLAAITLLLCPLAQGDVKLLDAQIDDWIKTASKSELDDRGVLRVLDSNVTTVLSSALEEGVAADDVERQVEKIVNRFGANPVYDYRLCRAAYQFLDPTYPLKFGDDLSPRQAAVKQLATMLVRAQVRDWCADPRKTERWVWFKAWVVSDRPNRYLFGMYVRRAGELPKTELGRWQRKRLVLFLGGVTNCDELYIGVEADTGVEGYDAWRVKVESAAKQKRIRPSGFSPTLIIQETVWRSKQDSPSALGFYPQLPFPDWGNPGKSDSPRVFREMN